MAEWPVLITGTMQYVVWVDAENSAEAHQSVQGVEHEYVAGEEPVDAWLEAETEPGETVYFVWHSHTVMPAQDAHVVAHKAEMRKQQLAVEQADCAAAGHPERETYADGPIWCRGCRSYLDAAELADAQ